LAYSPDGKTVVSAVECDGESVIRLWDVWGGKERATLEKTMDVTCSVAFSPDGKILAAGGWCYDWNHSKVSIKLWDVANLKQQSFLKGFKDDVWSIAYSPDGKTLAALCNTSIRLWDVPKGE
jgi:WD40 repeat protein